MLVPDLTSFNKTVPMRPPAKIQHESVTRYGCICFTRITPGYSEIQLRHYWVLFKQSRSKWSWSLKMILFGNSISTCPSLCMVRMLQLSTKSDWVSLKVKIFRMICCSELFEMSISWARCLINVLGLPAALS